MIFDTRDSLQVSPNTEEFMGPIKPFVDQRLGGLTHGLYIGGVGTV